MSPLRSIGTIDDASVRALMRQLQKQIDTLGARVSSVEANRMALDHYNDVTRPVASAVRKYSMIFNTDDSFPNISDGNDWRDPTGAVT